MPPKPKPKVGAFVPTKTTGIYKRLRADGTAAFYVRYTDATGKRRFELAGTFEQAKAKYAEVVGKTTKGEVVGDTSATLGSLLPGWRSLRDVTAKPRTRETEDRNVRLHIEPKWGRTKVRDISKNAITTWINGLTRQDGKPMNSGTKALVLAQLSSILDYAMDENVIAANPVKALSRKAKPKQVKYAARVLTPAELDALAAGVGRQTWLAPIIRFAALAGLRLGEVVGLQWGDVDFDAGTITVERQIGKDGRTGTPKGGVAATIPMIDPVRTILSAQRAEVAKQRLALGLGAITPETSVWTNSTGGTRQPRDVQRGFRWACERAGLKGVRFHDLRHTCATTLANTPGVVLTDVQAYLRHANLSTTLGYMHPRDGAEWSGRASSALAGFGG